MSSVTVLRQLISDPRGGQSTESEFSLEVGIDASMELKFTRVNPLD